MPVLFDSVGTTGLTNASRTAAGSPYTFTHTTVKVGATVILGLSLVGGGAQPWSFYAPTAVKCGGADMLFLGMRGNNDVANATGFVAAYACKAPNVGANTISITFPQTANCWAQTVAYTGVRGLKIRKLNSGSSTNPTTGAVTSALGDMVWSILGTANVAVSAATQTSRFTQSGTSAIESGFIQDAAGAATVTSGCTANTAAWAALAVDLSATSGAMGFDTTGGSVDSGNQSFLAAIKCYLPFAATVTSISLNVPTVNGVVYYYIYADSAGAPGALKGVTALFTPAGTGWVTQPLTTSVDLPAGVYWIGFTPTNSAMQYSRTVDKDAIADKLSAVSNSAYNTPPPPDPFGANQNYAGGTHSVYATYVAPPLMAINQPLSVPVRRASLY